MDEATLTIDGVGPMPVERPATVAELCDVVRRCAADSTAIYPVGGGTLLDYGTPPARPGSALSTARLDQVIDFPARDMTITVQSGITMARLQEITKAERLWLPIDVPNPETATLGGSIAANVSGPRRYGYGTFRDYVIGVTLVNDCGEETKSGGRVVKNVAGYDLMKLYTGSLGTLGVITQVTLKLKPMPEAWTSYVSVCARDRLSDVLDRLHRTATRPVMLGFSRGGFRADDRDQFWGISVTFEGGSDAVKWQAECIRRELADERFPVEDGGHGDGAMPGVLEGTFAGLVVRVGLKPSAAAAFAERAADISALHLHADGAGANIRGYVYEKWPLETAREVVARFLRWSEESGGNIVIKRCAPEWKKSLPVWGRPPTDLALQKAVKRTLDPRGIFNPGRFVTG